MSGHQNRSASNLLRVAKKMIRDSEETTEILCLPSREVVGVNRNKRNRRVRDYVKLPPSEFMAWWITSTGAKRKSSNVLLHYMKYKFKLNIKTDYRALLKTPVTPIEKVIHPGAYIHVGVRLALYQLFAEASVNSDHGAFQNILMQFFIDGLSISRSTRDGFWIIMMNIRNASLRRLTPKVIGVYYGLKKATNFNEFLYAFVMEVNDILDDGVVFNEELIMPKILNFVLDAPSRCSCKAVKAVTGYFGCDVCTTEGDFIHNRMAFLDLDAPLRNDNDYRNRVYDDYHHCESVLEMLPIDMIKGFPLDYLHCVLLGVMRWVLQFIRDAPKTLSSFDFMVISRRVEIFNETQPVEFQHKLRSFIDSLGCMKGSEFRQYLLFVAPLLLRGIVDDEKISNLITLQVASTIFSHKRFAAYYNEADLLMRMFINEFAAIYHPCHVVYVVHSSCHMKYFVDLYGPWDNFSTFEFESFNCTVKSYLKSNVKPLTQVTNRIIEIYSAPKHSYDQPRNIKISDQLRDGSFAQLKFYDLVFRVNQVSANLLLLKSGQAIKLVKIEQGENEVKLTGKPFKNRESVYSQVDTRRFNIFQSNGEFESPITFDVMEIDGKFWELKVDVNTTAYFPIYVEDGKSFSGSA